jgi:hypothetical protein
LPKNRNIQKATQIINQIRKEAVLHARGTRDTRQYLMAMLFDAVFRSTLKPPKTSIVLDEGIQKKHEEDLVLWEIERKRAMLLGALIVDKFAAIHKASPWPPANWAPFFTREQLEKAITRYPWQRDTVEALISNVLNANYDDIPGEVLKTKMINFYKKCAEQGELDNLVKEIQRQIPHFVKVLEDL